jgi:hypothetical protein
MNIWEFYIEYTNGIWTQVFPFFEQPIFNFKKENDEIFARPVFDGLLKFNDGYKGRNEYTILKSLAETLFKINIRIYCNQVLQIEGELNLKGNYDEDSKISEHTIKVIDQYSLIKDNESREKNIVEETNIYNVEVTKDIQYLEFKRDTNFIDPVSNPVGSLWVNIDSVDIFARQKRESTFYEASQLIGKDGWELFSTVGAIKTLVRDWTNTAFGSPDISDPDVTKRDIINLNFGTWDLDPNLQQILTFLDIVEIQTPGTVTINDIYRQKKEWWNGYNFELIFLKSMIDAGDLVCSFNIIFNYYGQNPIIYHRFQKLIEVIQKLVTDLDNTIQFDINSFTFLDTFENPGGQYPLSLLMLSGITDVLLIGGLEVGIEGQPAKILNLSFKSLMDLLKSNPLNFVWYLEKISSQYFFRLKHKTEVVKSLGTNPDLTNINGKDFTSNLNRFNFRDVDIFMRMHRNFLSGNEDFIGKDIVITYANKEGQQEISNQNFFFDINDIQNSGSSKYPGSSNNSYCILASDQRITLNGATTWTNDLTNPFDTFILSGTNLTLVDSGYAKCTMNTIEQVKSGTQYILSFDAVINSEYVKFTFFEIVNPGEPDEFYYSYYDYYSITGSNNFKYKVMHDCTLYIEIVSIFGVGCNIAMTNLELKEEIFEVRKVDGIISGAKINNADLAVANLDETLIANMPDAEVTVNDIQKTLSSEQILKLKEHEIIKVPITDIINEYDFNYLVKTGIVPTGIELESITQKLTGTTKAEIKGIF